MGNRFSRRQNVPEKEAENEAAEEAAVALPTQESAVTQEAVKAEAPEEKNEECPPECQQVVTPAAPVQKDDADPMECQAPVEPEQPTSTEPEVVAQTEALVDSLVSDAKAELPPEPVPEPELASTKDEVEEGSEAISAEEPSSEAVTEPEPASSLDVAPIPNVETEEMSELVPEPDSTSSQEAASEPEPAEPEAVTCTEADVMVDPILKSEPETKPGAEDVSESDQLSEPEGEPASISQPEAMIAENNELQQDLLTQELPEQIPVMPCSLNADITDDIPSSALIPDSIDTDKPCDLPTGDQTQEEEPAVSLEPKEPEEASLEPTELKACNDVNEEEVCESLKKLDLKGNDFVGDLIPSDVELSNDSAIPDVSTSTELM